MFLSVVTMPSMHVCWQPMSALWLYWPARIIMHYNPDQQLLFVSAATSLNHVAIHMDLNSTFRHLGFDLRMICRFRFSCTQVHLHFLDHKLQVHLHFGQLTAAAPVAWFPLLLPLPRRRPCTFWIIINMGSIIDCLTDSNTDETHF